MSIASFTDLTARDFLKKLKNLNTNGERRTFSINSKRKSYEMIPAIYMCTFGNRSPRRFTIRVLAIVPIPTQSIGRIKPEIITFLAKIPPTYPIMVLNMQLKPKGIPVIKSSKTPEIKPVVSPTILPFKREK